ncbi:MAG TPA: Phenylacetic acid catabolic protein [Candidatus Binataceae bacterium]|nr:Phenylacetic acid catabolic protein [Candidatus Binataceae bacterium]
MPIRRQFEARAIEAPDIKRGRLDAQYVRVLTRLLAAHALAEKLTADGYQRVLSSIDDTALRSVAEKNLEEERRHAALAYRVLAEVGVSESNADRLMITARRSPSFDAPRYFAEQASGALDLVMASISLDMTGLIMIGVNYKESSYAPHARAAEIILEEEAEHDLFSAAELGAAVKRFGAEAVNEALRQWLPRAVNFFGPPGSGFSYDCLRFGLKSKDNQELADLYLVMLEKRLAKVGLSMPRLTSDYPHALA